MQSRTILLQQSMFKIFWSINKIWRPFSLCWLILKCCVSLYKRLYIIYLYIIQMFRYRPNTPANRYIGATLGLGLAIFFKLCPMLLFRFTKHNSILWDRVSQLKLFENKTSCLETLVVREMVILHFHNSN